MQSRLRISKERIHTGVREATFKCYIIISQLRQPQNEDCFHVDRGWDSIQGVHCMQLRLANTIYYTFYRGGMWQT